MVTSYHLGFYRTGNSTIRSAEPENYNLEQNMEWIWCTVCEIFTFKLYCDLEIGVQGYSRSSKAALFDKSPYDCVFYASIYYRFRHSRILVENCYPVVFGAPVGGEAPDLRKDPWWRKTRMMGLSDGERILMMRSAVLTQSTSVTDGQTRQTDKRNWRGIYIL